MSLGSNDKIKAGKGDGFIVDCGGTNKIEIGDDAMRLEFGESEVKTGKSDDVVLALGGSYHIDTDDCDYVWTVTSLSGIIDTCRGNGVVMVLDRGGSDLDSTGNFVDTGDGNEEVAAEFGDNLILSGKSGDTLSGGTRYEPIIGGKGSDILTGGAGDDVIIIGDGKGSSFGFGAGSGFGSGSGEMKTIFDAFGSGSFGPGSGNDFLLREEGNSTLAYALGEDLCVSDEYDRGTGIDTLVLTLAGDPGADLDDLAVGES